MRKHNNCRNAELNCSASDCGQTEQVKKKKHVVRVHGSVGESVSVSALACQGFHALTYGTGDQKQRGEEGGKLTPYERHIDFQKLHMPGLIP